MSAASSYCRRRLAVHIAAVSFMNAYVYVCVYVCVCVRVSISPGLLFMLDIIFIIAFVVVRGGAA